MARYRIIFLCATLLASNASGLALDRRAGAPVALAVDPMAALGAAGPPGAQAPGPSGSGGSFLSQLQAGQPGAPPGSASGAQPPAAGAPTPGMDPNAAAAAA